MKGSNKNPLTQGSWDPLGPFLTKIEKIQGGTLTYQFSKFITDPILCWNFEIFGMYSFMIWLYINISVTKKQQSYQMDIFNTENSQKVPKIANFRSNSKYMHYERFEYNQPTSMMA